MKKIKDVTIGEFHKICQSHIKCDHCPFKIIKCYDLGFLEPIQLETEVDIDESNNN